MEIMLVIGSYVTIYYNRLAEFTGPMESFQEMRKLSTRDKSFISLGTQTD